MNISLSKIIYIIVARAKYIPIFDTIHSFHLGVVEKSSNKIYTYNRNKIYIRNSLLIKGWNDSDKVGWPV